MSRTVLVTGSSRGIGRAIAKAFAKQGDRVVINYIEQKAAAEQVKEEIIREGGRAMVVQCDVSDEQQVKQMIATIEQEFSPVEVLVNNAGIAEMKLFTDIETSMWERMFDVNVKGKDCEHFFRLGIGRCSLRGALFRNKRSDSGFYQSAGKRRGTV